MFDPATTRPIRNAAIAALLLGQMTGGPAQALTVTVGNGGCNYIGLQFALDELENLPGPHVLKLRTQTIAIPNGIVLDTSNTSYTFIGGHASCADAAPTPGQRTTLDASGGNDGTAFALNGNSSSVTPTVSLRGLVVRGGSRETGIGANPEGGGLEIRGRIAVTLDDATSIQENETGKGGGAYLRGDNASERAVLTIVGGSRLYDNTSDQFGGGIYCNQHGQVFHNDGLVEFNGSTSGGGIYMADTCDYEASVVAGSNTGVIDNFAVGSGGGLYLAGSAPVSIRGLASTPFRISDNLAQDSGGGLLRTNGSGPRADLVLESVVLSGNRAENRGTALLLIGAVDAFLRPRGNASSCSYAGVGLGACVAAVGNVVLAGTNNFGGALHTLQGTAGANPTLTIRNAALLDNRGPNVLSAEGPGRFDVEGTVMSGNQLYAASAAGPAALLWVDPDRFGPSPPGLQQRLRFSTVVNTTRVGDSASVFDHGVSGLDVTGSIVHTPALVSRSSNSTGTVVHNGCLLVHDSFGYPGTPAPPVVASPGLAADLSPSAASAALDQCGAALAPALDFRGQARAVDQSAVPNRFGPVDLGAIERPLDPPPTAPNLVISRSGTVVPDGSTTPYIAGVTDFGSVPVGALRSHQFLLQNSGQLDLNFSGHSLSGGCASGFRIGAVPANRPPGTQGFLTITFEPVTAGECVATYQLLSNDPDNSPYDFQVRGVGAADLILRNGFE